MDKLEKALRRLIDAIENGAREENPAAVLTGELLDHIRNINYRLYLNKLKQKEMSAAQVREYFEKRGVEFFTECNPEALASVAIEEFQQTPRYIEVRGEFDQLQSEKEALFAEIIEKYGIGDSDFDVDARSGEVFKVVSILD